MVFGQWTMGSARYFSEGGSASDLILQRNRILITRHKFEAILAGAKQSSSRC